MSLDVSKDKDIKKGPLLDSKGNSGDSFSADEKKNCPPNRHISLLSA